MRAIFIGVGIALCSFVAYSTLPTDIAPYVEMPGVFVGLFIAAILSAMIHGNAHGANWTVIGLVASMVNFPCYVGLAYAVLSFCFRNSEKGTHGD